MQALDARWFAECATSASWSHALLVQPGLEDIDAALADGDWDTCLLACHLTLTKLAFCDLLLLNRAPATPDEAVLLLAASEADTPITAALERVAEIRSSESEWWTSPARRPEKGRALVLDADRYVRRRMPIDVLPMRTPEGFFPSLKVAAELERLRTAVGLGPYEWSWWSSLS